MCALSVCLCESVYIRMHVFPLIVKSAYGLNASHTFKCVVQCETQTGLVLVLVCSRSALDLVFAWFQLTNVLVMSLLWQTLSALDFDSVYVVLTNTFRQTGSVTNASWFEKSVRMKTMEVGNALSISSKSTLTLGRIKHLMDKWRNEEMKRSTLMERTRCASPDKLQRLSERHRQAKSIY